jgi:hypothetical protein
MLRYSCVIAVFFLVSCVSNDGGKPQSPITECEDPRPQVCTMIYDPVCGTTGDGTRKTYASDCSACSNANVVSYEKGECSS